MKTLLTLITFFVFMSFAHSKGYDPKKLVVKGKIINLKTNKRLKRFTIFIDVEKFTESPYGIDLIKTYMGVTNSKGDFLIDIDINKHSLKFGIKATRPFAPVDMHALSLDTAKTTADTLDLGNVYLVPYDNEFEAKAQYMPIYKQQVKRKYRKFTLQEIDSIFNLPTSNYNMEMDEIDSFSNRIQNYDISRKKGYGYSTERYKWLTFTRVIK